MSVPHNFAEVVDALKKTHPRQMVALASAANATAISALVKAHEEDLIDYILFGPKAEILEIAGKKGLKLDEAAIRDIEGERASSVAAVAAVANGEADILMKGHVHTSIYLKAVLDKEKGLRGPGIMSHVFIWEALHLGRLIFVSDATINVYPDLKRKTVIVENAIGLAHVFGVEEPKVALLAAVETVKPKMPPTVDAAAITQMARRGQIKGRAVIDGPLALDNALSEEAAKVKGIDGPVAGHADILITPDIEAGNLLAKAYPFLVPGGEMAGIVVGAKKPVIITSRADSAKSKFYSIAAAAYIIEVEQLLHGHRET